MNTNVQTGTSRILMVGAGGVSEMHFEGFRMRPERVEVVAVVDPSAERRAWAQETYGVPIAFDSLAEAIDGIEFDAAVVCTPTHVRVEAVRALAAAGKHILVEKPMADGLDEAREMVRLADEAGVMLAVDQNFREHAGFEIVRDLIAEGRLGRVRAIDHHEYMRREDTGWRNEQSHHALMVMGVHWLDGFRRLIPHDASWLAARTFSAPSIAAVGETDALVQIRFGDEATVNYTDSFSSWISDWTTMVIGEAGTVRIHGSDILLVTADGEERIVNEAHFPENKPLTAYRQLENLLDAAASGVEASNSGRDNLKTIALIDGAYRSAASGEPITFTDGLL